MTNTATERSCDQGCNGCDECTDYETNEGVEVKMTKEEWIAAAAAKLQSYGMNDSQEYAESLYQTYVTENDDDFANDPEGAVAEDVTYWGD